ncbi:MAG: SUMF1/EgtB/PvdO family nonheme iron enzyme [Phycisphaerales bacterium]
MKTNRTNGCRTGVSGWTPRGLGWVLSAVAMMMLLGWGAAEVTARPTPPPLEDPAHWATITHAGNAPQVIQPPGSSPQRVVGRVDYEYQISRTETTSREWLDFLNAYKPFIPQSERRSRTLLGITVTWIDRPDGSVDYAIRPGVEDFAAAPGWRYAARYANWLHNEKVAAAWAFESGVYDTSTFGTNPDGTFNDQQARLSGAKFWLPTEDEWVKAAYFDPHKNGQDRPGYWRYPTTSDSAPIIGAPGVGQSNGGDFTFNYAVRAYGDVTSPWGLWDLSGGGLKAEWLESTITSRGELLPYLRRNRGSYAGEYLGDVSDRIDARDAGSWPSGELGVIRLARAVPAPGATLMVLLIVLRSGKLRER